MAKATRPRQVLIYADKNENEPFIQWLNALRDKIVRKRILARLRRLEQGNLGDCKSVGDGVSELRLFFGAGYRLYFGEKDGTIIVLLLGGDKRNQAQDIEKAKAYWQEYLNNA